MMPYPLGFPPKSKTITPIAPILVEIDLHWIYKEIRKGNVQRVNEDRLHKIPTNKILLTVTDNNSETFKYSVFDPMVPNTISLKDCRAIEHILDWYLFRKLDKVDFFQKWNDMICADVVKSTKIENMLREYLNKVGYILKDEKLTTRAKQVTTTELEEKMVNLSAKPDDGSQFKSLITKKDNEIFNLKSQLRIPNVHQIQTFEIQQV